MSCSDLNWLRGIDKEISLPKVVYFESYDYGGIYFHPMDEEIYVEGVYYDCKKGIIIVNTLEREDREVSATLAHEWRHHWQKVNGWKYDGIGWYSDEYSDYKADVIEYYTKSISEFDALLFEKKKTKADYASEWYEWVIKEVEENVLLELQSDKARRKWRNMVQYARSIL